MDEVTIEAVWKRLHSGHPVDDPRLLGALDQDDSVQALVARLANLNASGAFSLTNVRQIDAAHSPQESDEVRAAVAFRIAHLYLAAGDPAGAASVSGVYPRPDVTVPLVAALGCVRAVALGRLGATDSALALLDEVADNCGAGLEAANADPGNTDPGNADPWHTEMSMANITAHRIAVLAYAGRFDEAFALLGDPGLGQLSRERRRHLIADLHQGPGR